MHSESTITKPLVNDETLWTALEALGLGLFILDSEGYLRRYNDVASRVFGIDKDNGWGEQHISSIDSIMSLHLTEKVRPILDGAERFCQHGVTCTNASGMYQILDLACVPVALDNGHGTVLGVIRDISEAPAGNTTVSDSSEELRILSTVAASLSSSCELEQILEVILTGATASQGLGFNRAFLFLYDQDTNCLNGHLAIGPASAEEAGHIWQELEARDLSLGELLEVEKRDSAARTSSVNSLIKDMKLDLKAGSLISEACRKGMWINLETVADIDSMTLSFVDRLGTRKMALVPMISKGNLRGLLAADCAITGRPISNDSVQLLQILANQAAVAMERSRLYEEQIARASQLEDMNRLLGESQDHIIKIEKMSIIGELTAAIAHELRNPLAVIGGFANMMLKSEATDEQREYLNIIASETTRSESVLAEVLDFHEASKCDRRQIDFAELIKKNLGLIKGRLRKSDVEIALSLSPQPMTLRGNFDQLSHAFYQFFKLVAEDLIPPGRAEIRTEQKDNFAAMFIRLEVAEQDRERTIKTMKQIFSDNKASQRLTILVAGETIRYHGGNCGILSDGSAVPSLFVELPLARENTGV
ncbi:MAG: GAF domain-containing protein [Candidatus Zixiibacteriota bacterium]|nr:MAG: GAF domain-containing protein [candidate division Zixibacteria bacterium]